MQTHLVLEEDLPRMVLFAEFPARSLKKIVSMRLSLLR